MDHIGLRRHMSLPKSLSQTDAEKIDYKSAKSDFEQKFQAINP